MSILSSLFKAKDPDGERDRKPPMIECPRCGRFFPQRGHGHEPLCRDCAEIEKTLAS
jgi:formylmethanofuran dehydrogenase subunit E